MQERVKLKSILVNAVLFNIFQIVPLIISNYKWSCLSAVFIQNIIMTTDLKEMERGSWRNDARNLYELPSWYMGNCPEQWVPLWSLRCQSNTAPCRQAVTNTHKAVWTSLYIICYRRALIRFFIQNLPGNHQVLIC